MQRASKITLASILMVAASALAGEGKATLPPLPVAASSLGAVECGGFLYVYGGHMAAPHTYSQETTSGKLHRLDLGDPKSKWEELPGGTHLQGMNLAVHKGKVIRVGGMEPRNKKGEKPALFSTDEAVIYDPKAKKWEKLPALPEPRSSHDLVVIGDKLFVVGGWKLDGKGTSGTWHDTSLVLDLAAEKPAWKSFAQPWKRRAAKELWCSRHILDYDIKLQVEDGEKRVSLVRVRKGSMTDVMDNGRFVESGWDGRDVRGLFKVVEELLALKSSADYLVADFHPDLGFPIRVVWRPRVGMRREWIVRMDFPDVH